jgi:TonB-dependent receptor
VLSADAFGNIADQNVGNLLAQLPGIGVEVPEGDVAAVSIRGIGSDLNAVTIDGARAASANTASSMERGFTIDRISADFIERIEVTKALTPDMEGDSIGGAINLRTKSALDRKGRLITYMAGTSWNENRNTYRPMASLMYSDRLGRDQKLGVMLTASYNQVYKPRDVLYQNWQTTANSPAYFWVSDRGEDNLAHERLGLGVRLDYKLSEGHRMYLSTMYAPWSDELRRRKVIMSGVGAANIRPGYSESVTETINHAMNIGQNYRDRNVIGVNVQAGGEITGRSSVVDYSVNISESHADEHREIGNRTVSGTGWRMDRSRSPRLPDVAQISGPNLDDVTNQRFSTYNFQDSTADDIVMGGQINWKKSFGGALPGFLKTGARYRVQEREQASTYDYRSYVGADGVSGPNSVTRVDDDNVAQFIDRGVNYRPFGKYDPLTWLDMKRVLEVVRAHPEYFPQNVVNKTRDDLQNDARGKEEVYAAYVMGDARFGRFGVLAGVRVEETRLRGEGVRQEITPQEAARRRAWVGPVTPEESIRRTTAEWSNRREDTGGYRNYLPSLHLRYQATRDLLARASYSTGIGRPSFSNLLRTTTVDHDRMTVNANNTNLKPQEADNFDLSLEYYFEPAGVFSAGVFLKELSGFIYDSNAGTIPDGDDNGFGGDYAGYQLRTSLNGGSARVRGFEIAYQQRFNWLPGLWRGFGVQANYTWLEARGDYGAPGTTRTSGELPGFIPRLANVGLSYTYRAWDIRLKMNYRGTTLNTYNANPAAQWWRLPVTQYDASFKYNLRPWLSLYADVINVFNTPLLDTYVYVPNRHRWHQDYNMALKAGVSGRF